MNTKFAKVWCAFRVASCFVQWNSETQHESSGECKWSSDLTFHSRRSELDHEQAQQLSARFKIVEPAAASQRVVREGFRVANVPRTRRSLGCYGGLWREAVCLGLRCPRRAGESRLMSR